MMPALVSITELVHERAERWVERGESQEVHQVAALFLAVLICIRYLGSGGQASITPPVIGTLLCRFAIQYAPVHRYHT